MKKFYVIIAGSRSFTDYDLLKQKCDKILLEISKQYQVVIVEGGARGADQLGRRYAIERGYQYHTEEADWQDFSEPCVVKINKFGKEYNALSGHNRNERMAKMSDALIAFNKGTSGTRDMIKRAKKLKLKIREIIIKQ